MLYAPGNMGGPELKPVMHRSPSGRSSGPSVGRWLIRNLSARRAAPASVSSGIRPLGGSTTKEVRPVSTAVVPLSHQKSLYASARSELSRVPFTRPRLVVTVFFSSRFRSAFCAITRASAYAAASSSVRNSLSANSLGRSSGVTVRKSQTPPKSG